MNVDEKPNAESAFSQKISAYATAVLIDLFDETVSPNRIVATIIVWFNPQIRLANHRSFYDLCGYRWLLYAGRIDFDE